MKLFIPTLGTKFVLLKPWTIVLQDNRYNETFWLALHGKPVRQEYFSGYDHINRKYITSPVQTKDCDRRCEHPATPIKTIFPKGTTLVLEKISIRKGLRGDDHLVFRIPSNRTSSIPSGKFRVSLDDFNNKLEATVETINKYPEGKFILQILAGKEYGSQYKNCTCYHHPCTCGSNQPDYRKEYLTWMSDPENRRGGRMARVEHHTNTAGHDTIANDQHGWYSNSRGYSKSFGSMTELLSWAEKKKFTAAHINAFIVRYNEKKALWEQDKQTIAAI
jgi:hypothetical protein